MIYFTLAEKFYYGPQSPGRHCIRCHVTRCSFGCNRRRVVTAEIPIQTISRRRKQVLKLCSDQQTAWHVATHFETFYSR